MESAGHFLLLLLRFTSLSHRTCLPPSTRIVSPVTKSHFNSASTASAIDFLPAPDAKRRRLFDGRELVLRCFGRRENRARRDRVDANLVRRELQRERLGKTDHTGLRDVIRKITGVSRPAAERQPVGKIDDVASAGTMMCGHAAREQMNAERKSTATFSSNSSTVSSLNGLAQ